MPEQRLERMTFETPREAEYFDARELQAQTGQPSSNFAGVVLKELVDNALDAAEKESVTPFVHIRVAEGDDTLKIAVGDNGPDLSSKTITKILNFETRTSDKAAYQTPTRGAQGNALKTVLGIPYALGLREGDIYIASRGVGHKIKVWPDPAGALRKQHDTENHGWKEGGAVVVVTLPRYGQDFDPKSWGRAFSAFNPHALVKISTPEEGSYLANTANTDETKTVDFYPTVPFPDNYKKFLPTNLPSPHWYDIVSLKKLIFAHIREAHHGGEDLLLRDFVRENFKGLSGTAKAKAVCDALPEIKHLSDFEEHENLASRLLHHMQAHTTPPKPAVLGLIGEDHFRRRFKEFYYDFDPERFWYKKVQGSVDNVPFVVEAAVADVADSDAELFTGVNFSPTFSDPLASTVLDPGNDDLLSVGIKGFLNNAAASCDAGIATAVHLSIPAPTFLDRGKTRLNLPMKVDGAVAQALASTTKILYKEEQQRKRDAAAAAKAQRNRERTKKRQNMSDMDAVFEVMEEAWSNGTGDGTLPISVRSLFYQVRPLVQKYGYTDKELGYSYFSNTLVPKYQREVRELPGVYYEPRGVLYEPHTGREVPLVHDQATSWGMDRCS